MTLSSPAFADNREIPSTFTCDGGHIIPPLVFDGAPTGTASFAVFLEDPDTGHGTFVHWVMFNIDPKTRTTAQGQAPKGIDGVNGTGKTGYFGPCPPTGTHHYIFTLTAMDTMLDLHVGASMADVLEAAQNHVLGQAKLVGLYQRH